MYFSIDWIGDGAYGFLGGNVVQQVQDRGRPGSSNSSVYRKMRKTLDIFCKAGYIKNASIKRGRLAQLVRAFALHAKCRGFESLIAHHFACGKNGERSRKASLHAASAALHSNPKVLSLATA